MSHAESSESPAAGNAYQQFIIPDPPGRTIFRKCCGVVAILLALLLTIVVSASLDVVYGVRESGRGIWWLALGLATVSGMLFPILLRMGLGLLARSGARVLANDSRAPLLYLRSFQDDARIIDRGDLWRLVFFASRYETPERSLAKAIDDVGTLVAIGKPGETLRPCGAARMYVDGDHWQEVVSKLVADSRLVVLRIGRTRGFWWEVQHVLERCDPRKILFYLPKGDRGAHYQFLREQAAGVLPCPLPEQVGRASFLGFGPGWQPQLLGTAGASWFSRLRRLVTGSPAPILRDALNPLLAETGVRPRRMPLRLHEWFALTVAFLFVLGLPLTALMSLEYEHSVFPEAQFREHEPVRVKLFEDGKSEPHSIDWNNLLPDDLESKLRADQWQLDRIVAPALSPDDTIGDRLGNELNNDTIQSLTPESGEGAGLGKSTGSATGLDGRPSRSKEK